MKHFLAPDIWPVIAIAVIWWTLSLAPIAYSTLVAFRAKPVLPRRLLFVGTVSTLCYGLLVSFLILLIIPLAAFRNYIAPTLAAEGDLTTLGNWLANLSDLISQWGWFVVPLILAATAFYLSRYLAARWPQIVIALGPNNSFKPSPLRGLGPTGSASGGPA